MLHWNCPECGRECEPRQRDCPSCYPETVSGARVEVGAKAESAKKDPSSFGKPARESRTAVLEPTQPTQPPPAEPGRMSSSKPPYSDSDSGPPVSNGVSYPVDESGMGGMRVLSVRVTAVAQRTGSREAPPGIPVDQTLSMLSRHVSDARLGRLDGRDADLLDESCLAQGS